MAAILQDLTRRTQRSQAHTLDRSPMFCTARHTPCVGAAPESDADADADADAESAGVVIGTLSGASRSASIVLVRGAPFPPAATSATRKSPTVVTPVTTATMFASPSWRVLNGGSWYTVWPATPKFGAKTTHAPPSSARDAPYCETTLHRVISMSIFTYYDSTWCQRRQRGSATATWCQHPLTPLTETPQQQSVTRHVHAAYRATRPHPVWTRQCHRRGTRPAPPRQTVVL